jgi:hypothetical protein
MVSSALAGEFAALCSAAKDFVPAAKAQEGILILYPTANELAESTMAYAAAKKRYLAEFRSAMPILIAIGLKQSVDLYLNRRNALLGIHDLNAVNDYILRFKYSSTSPSKPLRMSVAPTAT